MLDFDLFGSGNTRVAPLNLEATERENPLICETGRRTIATKIPGSSAGDAFRHGSRLLVTSVMHGAGGSFKENEWWGSCLCGLVARLSCGR